MDCSDTQITLTAKLVQMICVFLLSWQSIFRIPDIAMTTLFKFLKLVLGKFAEILKMQNLKEISNNFPDTFVRRTTLTVIIFISTLCVRSVTAFIYSRDLLPTVSSTEEIIKCSFVCFPRHPQR